MKPCILCKSAPAKTGEKYCTECRKVVLREMRETGYLRYVHRKNYRTADQQEDTRETKYGPCD